MSEWKNTDAFQNLQNKIPFYFIFQKIAFLFLDPVQ